MNRLHYFSLVLLLCLPWLNPFATGPSPAVVPWLFSWACGAALIGLSRCRLGLPEHFFCRRWASIAAHAGLAAGLVSCVMGLLQYFGLATNFSPLINPTQLGEAFANLRQRNQFASLTNIALAALVWTLCQTPSDKAAKPRLTKLLFAFFAAGLLAVGNAISSSRTGLFELLLLCMVLACWGLWRHVLVRPVLLCALAAYAVAVFAAPYLAGLDVSMYGAVSRLDKDTLCSSRLTLWSNVLHLIAQKPWLGWGWGELDYAHFVTLYNEPRFCDILDNAHNLPLHLAVELGVPAAVLLCGGFAGWVLCQKPWAERDATRQMAWAVMAVILLHSLLEYPLWYGPFQMAFGLCVLLLWHSSKPLLGAENASKRALNKPLALMIRAQAAIILIAFIIYAAWDYRRISQIYLPPESRAAAYRDDTLNKLRGSWLFADQVQFAELLTTPLTPANAAWTLATAKQLLHYSPEARVVEKVIESAVILGEDDEAAAYLARYKAAFPKEHAVWAKTSQPPH